MKRYAAVAFVLVVSFAGVAAAETLPHGLKKSVCAPGKTYKKSHSVTNERDAKQEYRRLIASSNFCTNEKITINIQIFPPGGVFTNELTCVCTKEEDLENVGCDSPEKKQPTVTTIIPKDQTKCVSDVVTISKCAKDPEAAYEAACKRGKNMARVDVKSATAATLEPRPAVLPPSTRPATQPPIETPVANQEHLVKALTTAGIPESEATAVAQKNPNEAAKLIAAIAGGDTELAKSTAATLGVTLNKDLDASKVRLVVDEARAQQEEAQRREMERQREYQRARTGSVTGVRENTGFENRGDPWGARYGGDQYGAGRSSPFSGFGSGGSPFGSGFGSGSPFGNVSPFFSSGSGQQPPPASIFSGNPYSSPKPVSEILAETRIPAPASQQASTVVPIQPVATIIAQPSTVFAGRNVVVSWSAFGTRTDTPCEVSVTSGGRTEHIARGNEGTRTIVATSTGAALFSVACEGNDGTTLQKSASVTVR